MSSEQQKPIIDIGDRRQTHSDVAQRLKAMEAGFAGLSLDYGYYIENNFGPHKINDLRDNVLYRLESCLFHLELALREHDIIEAQLKHLAVNDPQKVFGFFYPKNPVFQASERKVSFIFDSIVFHAASSFDYISVLINFLSIKDRDKTPPWSSIASAANDPNHEIVTKPVAAAIVKADSEFVTKLYDHRSELIHRRADLSENAFNIIPSTASFDIRYLCPLRLRKTFKAFIEKEKYYTVGYFSAWIINKTLDIFAELILELKADIVAKPRFSRHNFDKNPHKPILLMVDPETNYASTPSSDAWNNFHKSFPIKK